MVEYKRDVRRTIPNTLYCFDNKSSAKYDPSCPVIPVMNASFGDIGVGVGVELDVGLGADAIVIISCCWIAFKLMSVFHYI